MPPLWMLIAGAGVVWYLSQRKPAAIVPVKTPSCVRWRIVDNEGKPWSSKLYTTHAAALVAALGEKGTAANVRCA